MADHVVFVLYAGGVRQQESVLQRYLTDSQGYVGSDFEGNILYNMLDGASPALKIVYGTDPPGQPEGSQPIPAILTDTLQTQGTLFREVNMRGGGGHYSGLNTGITGNYGVGQGLKQRPIYPTIFEYVRKHLGVAATKTWMIGNTSQQSSIPLLNYSEQAGYGRNYGANFLSPSVTFSDYGEDHLANAKLYDPTNELEPIDEMKQFFDNSFNAEGGLVPGIQNTFEEKLQIKDFVKRTFEKQSAGTIYHAPVNDLSDVRTIGYTCEVLAEFQPTLTIVNMHAIDSFHTNFTNGLRAMHRCDHGIGHLWNFIQGPNSGMANNTIMLIQPEIGRDLNPNPILDENDFRAYDHGNTENTKRMFSMMVGPGVDANLVMGAEANPVGEAVDIVPTIADILGIKGDVMGQGLLDGNAMSLFDRI
jgi:hypothetical protein